MMLAVRATLPATWGTGDALGVRDPLTEAGVVTLPCASFSLST